MLDHQILNVEKHASPNLILSLYSSDPNMNKTAAGSAEGGAVSASSGAVKGKGGGVLPSFNDILWCPDVDGDVMSNGAGGNIVAQTFGEENLDDLSDLVGPELAGLMNPPSATAVKVSRARGLEREI